MSNFKIIADSSCDLSLEQFEKYNIDFVPFYVSFDDANYLKEHTEITVQQFFDKLINEKLFSKTSLPSVSDYMDCFKPYLDNGQDILCFCLSSKFSGSFQSAVNAKNILEEEYPNQKIIIVDCYNATSGSGLLVLEARKMRDAGLSISKTHQICELLKPTVDITFTIDSLEYLKKGGRIGVVSALAGTLLNVKPIILLKDGELKPFSKIRGRKKAIAEVIKIVIEKFQNNIGDRHFILLGAQCQNDCLELKSVLENDYNLTFNEPTTEIGLTIGTHTGPSAIGIASIEKYESFM